MEIRRLEIKNTKQPIKSESFEVSPKMSTRSAEYRGTCVRGNIAVSHVTLISGHKYCLIVVCQQACGI